MPATISHRHFADALHVRDIRFFLAAVAFFTLASRATLVIIGFQIYSIARHPAALGFLGLVEAIPAISLVLFGGHVADHFNRRKILLTTRAVSCVCALALAALSWNSHHASLLGLYAVIFVAGIAPSPSNRPTDAESGRPLRPPQRRLAVEPQRLLAPSPPTGFPPAIAAW